MASMAPVFTLMTVAAAEGALPFWLMPSTTPATSSWSWELMVKVTLSVVVRLMRRSRRVLAGRVCDWRNELYSASTPVRVPKMVSYPTICENRVAVAGLYVRWYL